MEGENEELRMVEMMLLAGDVCSQRPYEGGGAARRAGYSPRKTNGVYCMFLMSTAAGSLIAFEMT